LFAFADDATVVRPSTMFAAGPFGVYGVVDTRRTESNTVGKRAASSIAGVRSSSAG